MGRIFKPQSLTRREVHSAHLLWLNCGPGIYLHTEVTCGEENVAATAVQTMCFRIKGQLCCNGEDLGAILILNSCPKQSSISGLGSQFLPLRGFIS